MRASAAAAPAALATVPHTHAPVPQLTTHRSHHQIHTHTRRSRHHRTVLTPVHAHPAVSGGSQGMGVGHAKAPAHRGPASRCALLLHDGTECRRSCKLAGASRAARIHGVIASPAAPLVPNRAPSRLCAVAPTHSLIVVRPPFIILALPTRHGISAPHEKHRD